MFPDLFADIPIILTNILSDASFTPADYARFGRTSKAFLHSVTPLLWERVEIDGEKVTVALFVDSLVGAVGSRDDGDRLRETFGRIKSLSMTFTPEITTLVTSFSDAVDTLRSLRPLSNGVCTNLRALQIICSLAPPAPWVRRSHGYSADMDNTLSHLLTLLIPPPGPSILRLVSTNRYVIPYVLRNLIFSDWTTLRRVDIDAMSPDNEWRGLDDLGFDACSLSTLFPNHPTPPLLRLYQSGSFFPGPSRSSYTDPGVAATLRGIRELDEEEAKRLRGGVQVVVGRIVAPYLSRGDGAVVVLEHERIKELGLGGEEKQGGCEPVVITKEEAEKGRPWWSLIPEAAVEGDEDEDEAMEVKDRVKCIP